MKNLIVAVSLALALAFAASAQGAGPISVAGITAVGLADSDAYLLGWSPAGTIAFISVEILGGEAGGATSLTLTIQDTVTDEVLSSTSLDTGNPYGDYGDSSDLVGKAIAANAPKLAALLKSQGIDSAKGSVVEGGAFAYRGDSYEVKLTTRPGSRTYHPFEEPPRTIDALDSFKVEIAKGAKSKAVFERRMGPDDVVTSARVSCVAISPFEDRSAVFVVIGRPQRSELIATGAHLKIGFE